MKIVVFSDIHGNFIALEKMLKKTIGLNIDYYIHLGDIFGYFFEQKKIIKLFMEKNILNLKGNHDSYFLEVLADIKSEDKYSKKYGLSYLHNSKQMNTQEKEYIHSLKKVLNITYKNYKIFFCHGSPTDYLNGRIYPDTENLEFLNSLDYNLYFFGHTHYRLEKRVGGKMIMNPGSLGLPRDGKGFSYLFCDLDKNIFKFNNIELNDKEIKMMYKESHDSELFKSIKKVLER